MIFTNVKLIYISYYSCGLVYSPEASIYLLLCVIEDSAYYRLINNSIEYKPGTTTTKTEHNNS